MGKFRPPSPPLGKLQPPTAPRHTGVSFSFKHYRDRAPFRIADARDGYPLALLTRLRDLCSWAVLELKTSRNQSLRCHPIDWNDTSEKEGFDHINAALREQVEPYQFSVSANAHGRVHGFFIDEVFYVVWLDPKHLLYPGA